MNKYRNKVWWNLDCIKAWCANPFVSELPIVSLVRECHEGNEDSAHLQISICSYKECFITGVRIDWIGFEEVIGKDITNVCIDWTIGKSEGEAYEKLQK